MPSWSKALEVAQTEKGLHYYYPEKPFLCRIPSGLEDGRKIYVHGFIPPECKRFAVNFLTGGDPESSDIAFHVNPRFDEKDVVMNSRTSGDWGGEERIGSMPLKRMSEFLICVTTLQSGYELEINNVWVANFNHKTPFDTVVNLHVEGDVDIQGIHILDKTIFKDSLISIPGGVQPSHVFVIEGKCADDFSTFSINFQCGDSDDDDIAFHFNPRGGGSGQVVRNSYISGSWGDEERDGDLPFKSGEKFTVKVNVLAEGFDVSVDGKHFTRYEHRLPTSRACKLTVKDDAEIHKLSIEIPPSARSLSNYVKAELSDPDTPAKVQISGFRPGSLLNVVGLVKKEPSRFKINVQKGPDDDSDDITLHVNPRWDEGSPKIVLNSREGGSWADEEMWQSEFPFDAGARFEITIECEEDGYRIEIDGYEQLFKHRMDHSGVQYVYIDGCVDLKRVLVA